MKPAKRASPPSKKYPPRSFMYKVRKRRIIETLAAFIGGGWLTWEAVHWILVEHYHFPEKLLDIALVTIIGAMLCTLTWRWFGGREKKKRRIKLEFILIPLFILITAYLDVRFIQQLGEPEYISVHEPKEYMETRAENSVAVLYFENNTGDEELNYWRKALSDLIIADLSQSKYIQVMTGDKLYHILRELEQEEAESFAWDVLNEVATRGRARHILTGNYVKAGELFQINITLQEAGSGRLIGSESVEGKGVESILSTMVDELTRRVKTNFQLTEEQIAGDIDNRIEDITTSSPEALKYYLEGVRYEYMAKYHLSLQELEKAIALDPSFALAYLFMHHNYFNLGNAAEYKKYIQKAYELSEQLPARERYLIQGTFYSRSENTYDKAIEAFNKLLEFYPEDIEANLMIGVVYINLEQWDEAREHYEFLVENNKELMWIYMNLAGIYGIQGKYDKARKVLEVYLNNFGDNSAILYTLVQNYLYQGKYDLAQTEMDKAMSLNLTDSNRFGLYALQGDIYVCREEWTLAEKEYLKFLDSEEQYFQYMGRRRLAGLYRLQGKFKKAQAQIKQGIGLANKSGDMNAKSFCHMYLSYLYLLSRSPAKALEECNKAWKIAVDNEHLQNQRGALYLKGMIHLEMKSVDEAERVATELKEMIEKGLNKKLRRLYYNLAGSIELERKNFDQAIEHLKMALSLVPANDWWKTRKTSFTSSLAQAYYDSGDLEKSQEAYEEIISRPTSIFFGFMRWYKSSGDIYAKSFYMLGKIYEQKDFRGKAIEHYQKFLSLWKDADPGIAEVEDARKRLAGLTN
jgi:tetratricopeptide (TPR) repeat protein